MEEHKTCTRCLKPQPLSSFNKKPNGSENLRSRCRECEKELSRLWRQNNRESHLEYNRRRNEETKELRAAWRAEDRKRRPEGYKARHQEWYAKNKAHVAQWQKSYQRPNTPEHQEHRRLLRRGNYRDKAQHPEYLAANRAKTSAYLACKMKACPPWADKEAIRKVYVECAKIEAETGVLMHVDHIIPLRGKHTCGLHVHWNLQILTATENIAKGNRNDSHSTTVHRY